MDTSSPGEIDQAFALLEQAYDQREGTLLFLKQPAADRTSRIERGPATADLLRRIGLPE